MCFVNLNKAFDRIPMKSMELELLKKIKENIAKQEVKLILSNRKSLKLRLECCIVMFFNYCYCCCQRICKIGCAE